MITIPPRFVIFGQKWAKIEKIDLKIFCWPERKMECSIWPCFYTCHVTWTWDPITAKPHQTAVLQIIQVWIKYPQTARLKFSDCSGLFGSKKSVFFWPGFGPVREFNINAGPSTVFADPIRFDPWISGLDATLSGDPSI